jgi:hypothetical protein
MRGIAEGIIALILLAIAISASLFYFVVYTNVVRNSLPKSSVLVINVQEAKIVGGYLIITLQLVNDGVKQIQLQQARLMKQSTLLATTSITTTDGNTVLNPGEAKNALLIFNNLNVNPNDKITIIITYAVDNTQQSAGKSAIVS